ncbi:ABC transporter permease [Nocardioides campestrisoli]|uniref:ABC transporter permease n=1 Tax=Nocardioides campestrisoli TaxID=2736757 RepID=UPI00163DB93C|nr:ABC transporter permease [Nocardioides campestrisoli]
MTTPTRAVLRTEARLFAREPGSLFWIMLFPVALLCILGAVPSFRDPQPELGGLRTIDLYIPVTVLLSMIMAALMAMPPVLMGYRERGILRRLRTTPVSPGTVLLTQAALHAAAVLVSLVLLLAVGRLAFDIALPGSVLGYAVALLLAMAAAFSMGAVVAAVSPNVRVGTAIGMVFFFPSMFTAGVWFPVQAMGGLLRDAVVLTPLGAASEALHTAGTGSFPGAVDLVVVAVWTAGLALLAVRAFRWD